MSHTACNPNKHYSSATAKLKPVINDITVIATGKLANIGIALVEGADQGFILGSLLLDAARLMKPGEDIHLNADTSRLTVSLVPFESTVVRLQKHIDNVLVSPKDAKFVCVLKKYQALRLATMLLVVVVGHPKDDNDCPGKAVHILGKGENAQGTRTLSVMREKFSNRLVY